MTTMELISTGTLSDDEAVARLFELTARGNAAADELAQLEAMVYGRLVEAYEGDELPVLANRAA